MKIRKPASVILQIVICVAGLFVVCGAAEPASMQNVQSAGVAAAAYDTYGALSAAEDALALLENASGNYTYMVREDEDGKYVIITGNVIGGLQGTCSIPAAIYGIPVKEIAADAFSGNNALNVTLPEQIRVIGDRAFADNKNLGVVCVPNADCVIGEDAFAGCGKDFFICYGENTEGKENLLEEYAKANGMTALEVVDTTGQGVIVNYPEQPLVLTPDVRQFFDWESSEYAEDARDYGFEEWYAPCGDFCAMPGGGLRIEASSELASSSDRYAAKNLNSLWGWGRERTWAEGVDGFGIGESITYQDSMYWNISNAWDGLKYKEWDSDGNLTKRDQYGCIKDGYKHYVEICIVNGYAKNQKTWEENGRIKRLLMYVEDEPYAYLELEDTIYPQYFLLPPDDIKVAEGDEITFRFVIEDVYPGTTYEDTCLTGLVIEFTGRHGH